MTDKMQPKIRFKGFTDPWEQRKLGDLLIKRSRPVQMIDSKSYKLVTVKRRNNGIVLRGIYKGAEVKVKSQFMLKRGDFVISKRQVVHGADGIVPKSLEGAIVSNEYLILNGGHGLNTDFFGILATTPMMYKMFFLSSYGIDIEKLVFNVQDWEKRKITLPGLMEQEHINHIIKTLKSSIAANQNKVDQLKQLKKLLMQKVFSQEWRFKGFTDPWEQRKFSQIAQRSSEQTDDLELPRVEFEDIVSGEGKLREGYVPKHDSRKGVVFRPGDILFGKLRPYLKNYLHPDFKGIALGDFWVLTSSSFNTKFIYQLIQSDHFQRIANISTGTKMPRSDWNLVSETKFFIPTSKIEQRTIGDTLFNLELNIAANQAF